MKKFYLLTVLSVFLLVSCSTYKECQTNLKESQETIKSLNYKLYLLSSQHQELQNDFDSLSTDYKLLDLSWGDLVMMFDSLRKTKVDTVWFKPQCTLFYEAIDTIAGYQFYRGYDGKHYRLRLDEDTITQTFYWFEKDTIRYKYRFTDSTIYVDSIVSNATGSKILWASTLCEKYMTNNCESRLVLGQVLTGGTSETKNICSIRINAIKYNGKTISYPNITMSVNDTSSQTIYGDDSGYISMVYCGFTEVKSLSFTPDLKPGETLLIKDIYINNLKINSNVAGWTITQNPGVEYLGNNYLSMSYGSKIRFKKP